MQMSVPYTPAKPLHHPTRRRAIISLTPLIDVVFILLVFFMLASSFLNWRSIALDTVLPSTASHASTNKQPLLLGVSATETQLNGEALPMAALLPRLQQRLATEPDLMVHVQPIGETPLQAVVAVLDQLQVANITGITMIRDHDWTATNNASEVTDDEGAL